MLFAKCQPFCLGLTVITSLSSDCKFCMKNCPGSGSVNSSSNSGGINWTLCIISDIKIRNFFNFHCYAPRNEVRGGYIGFTLSVCPSVCPLTFCVRPVASTVQDGFFPYLVLIINSMTGCVACYDPWPLTFKVIRPGLRKSCLLCSVYSSGWILFIFGANDHYH